MDRFARSAEAHRTSRCAARDTLCGAGRGTPASQSTEPFIASSSRSSGGAGFGGTNRCTRAPRFSLPDRNGTCWPLLTRSITNVNMSLNLPPIRSGPRSGPARWGQRAPAGTEARSARSFGRAFGNTSSESSPLLGNETSANCSACTSAPSPHSVSPAAHRLARCASAAGAARPCARANTRSGPETL